MRPDHASMDNIIDKPINILNHGFIRLVDYMGDDAAVVQAARVSYGAGTKSVSEDRGLIRYLMRHHHTTPFEMCEIKLHVKLPIFVARQWVRHRTANINEYSARYSILHNEFYLPAEEVIGSQSTDNKQGRTNSVEDPVQIIKLLSIHHDDCYTRYEHLLRRGVARELARSVLPVSVYTEWYWKVDLHNLLHFLQLRMDKHAQYEIRCYANAIASIVKEWVPLTWEAFCDYRLNGVSLPYNVFKIVATTLGELGVKIVDDKRLEDLSSRERTELKALFEEVSSAE